MSQNKNQAIKPTISLYKDIKPLIDSLSDEQAGVLIKSIFQYSCDQTEPDICDPMVRGIYSFVKIKIDDLDHKYKDKAEKNRANAKKRWQPKTTENCGENAIASDRNADECLTGTGTDTVTDTNIKSSKDDINNKKSKPKKDFFEINNFDDLFEYWNDNKKGGKYKNKQSYNLAFNKLKNLTENDFEFAKMCIENSLTNNYSGFAKANALFLSKNDLKGLKSNQENKEKENAKIALYKKYFGDDILRSLTIGQIGAFTDGIFFTCILDDKFGGYQKDSKVEVQKIIDQINEELKEKGF